MAFYIIQFMSCFAGGLVMGLYLGSGLSFLRSFFEI